MFNVATTTKIDAVLNTLTNGLCLIVLGPYDEELNMEAELK